MFAVVIPRSARYYNPVLRTRSTWIANDRGRGLEHAAGLESRFFLQLADRRLLGRLAIVDQTCGHFCSDK
jgi:hypothetical protein